MISRRERQATIRQQRPRLKIYTFTALVKRRASLLQRVYETLLAAKVRVIAIFELCPILCPP